MYICLRVLSLPSHCFGACTVSSMYDFRSGWSKLGNIRLHEYGSPDWRDQRTNCMFVSGCGEQWCVCMCQRVRGRCIHATQSVRNWKLTLWIYVLLFISVFEVAQTSAIVRIWTLERDLHIVGALFEIFGFERYKQSIPKLRRIIEQFVIDFDRLYFIVVEIDE